MARLHVPFTGLFVALTLALGLVPGGAQAAAAQAPKAARAFAPFPGVDGAATRWVSYVGHIGGPTQAVAVEGNLAYAGEGFGLSVLDVSVPGSLTMLGKTEPLPGLVNGVAVAGGYAYVADYDAGLRVVDVSTPAVPVEASSYVTPGNALGVATAGGYAYVADYRAGLRVVSVSVPSASAEMGFCDTPGSALDVVVAGEYPYVADYDGGLFILRFTETSRVYLPLALR